jgi:5'(3')-deoxyribonucleotidase
MRGVHASQEWSEMNGAFVLGVDLDGVCGDYESALRRVVAIECGVTEDSIPAQRTWGFSESGWPVHDENHHRELHRLGVVKHQMFATMPEMQGASDALWRLSDAGIHIRLITHRLYVSWDHADVVSQTVAWLQQERPDGRPLIPYRDLCFMADKAEVGADLYVDDAPHNVLALRRAKADVICFTHAYNEDIPGLRADNWEQVEAIVRERAAERGLVLGR